MKATEIVEKLKNVLLSSETEKVEEIELKEEVEVSAELAEEEAIEDMPKEESKEDKYVTKQEMEAALAEVKAMYDELMEKMSYEEEMEVPQEVEENLSKDEPKQEVKEELSAVEPLTHSPEEVQEQKQRIKLSQNRMPSILDRVYAQISNNNR